MKSALKSCVLSLALLCVYLTGTQAVSSQAKRFDLDSAAKLARLSDPQISPDGKSIVVVVARANYEDNRPTLRLGALIPWCCTFTAGLPPLPKNRSACRRNCSPPMAGSFSSRTIAAATIWEASSCAAFSMTPATAPVAM